MEKPKILVVDDEEIIRKLMVRTLGEKEYDIEVAEDGVAALEKTRRTVFNLLITDLKMPRLDGVEVLEEIKAVNPYVEVIVITGYPTIELAVKAIKIGAFDFICKPFDVQQLQTIVQNCLERQKFNINFIQLTELMTLLELSKTVTHTTTLNSLLSNVLTIALELTKAKRGSILMYDETIKKFSIRIARGLPEAIVQSVEIGFGEAIVGKVAQAAEPLLVRDIEMDPRFQQQNKPQYETKSFLSIPFVSNPIGSALKVLGVINITDKISKECSTDRDQTLISVLANQATIAIENLQLYRQLQDKIQALQHSIQQLYQTQNQLIHTEKLASVGQLAFGIAHEIRNPLGIILGGVDYLASIGKKNKDMEKSIKKIRHSIGRANNIIIDLLKFSQASKLQLVPANLCELIDRGISFIRNQARLSNVQINRLYPEEDFQIKTDVNMLQQMFFNLFTNALDAMPQGGELTINVYSQKELNQDEPKVTIEVSDTGVGIPQDKLSKIFDPFFTTKESGRGTGLGLSIVHLILERHNGTIEVESRVNEGTKFTIRLPKEKGSVEKKVGQEKGKGG